MHQNASFYSKNLKNLLGRGHNPLPIPYPQWEGGHFLPTPYSHRGLRPLDLWLSAPRPSTFKPWLRPCLCAILTIQTNISAHSFICLQDAMRQISSKTNADIYQLLWKYFCRTLFSNSTTARSTPVIPLMINLLFCAHFCALWIMLLPYSWTFSYCIGIFILYSKLTYATRFITIFQVLTLTNFYEFRIHALL